jgi:hypothetical protein
MSNAYADLERALIDGKLGHRQVATAYRAWIRERKDIPDGIKNLLSVPGGGDLLGGMFLVISQTVGRMELAYRRGYQAGLDAATMVAERR